MFKITKKTKSIRNLHLKVELAKLFMSGKCLNNKICKVQNSLLLFVVQFIRVKQSKKHAKFIFYRLNLITMHAILVTLKSTTILHAVEIEISSLEKENKGK